MTLDGKTEVYGIVGYPVGHSLSPVFQNASFKHFGISAVYVPFEVKPDELTEAIRGLRALGVRGVNVTLPHKEKALELADFKEEHAQKIGAANTLKFTEEGLYAYNTDWVGFIKSVKKILPELGGIRALILGAGGSARAIVYALSSAGADLFLWNRTKERAERLCEDFGCKVVEKPEDTIGEVKLIVNTTSSGLKDDDPWLFDYDLLKPSHAVVDIIYRETPLLRSAREKGCVVQDGLDMLLYQGMESFRIWTGLDVPYEVVRLSLTQHLARREGL